MKAIKLIAILLLVILSVTVKAITSFGFTSKVTFIMAHAPLKSIRISVGGALQREVGFFGSYKVAITYQNSISLYQGGVGSSVFAKERYKYELDWLNGMTISFPFSTRPPQDIANAPLYIVGQFQIPSITNKYNTAINYSSSFIANNHRKNQWVGQVGFKADKFQIAYYNDGTPYHWFRTGDGLDRWWTGGGILDIYAQDFRMQFAYDKFTGYSPLAFELSNSFGLNKDLYRDINQFGYNRSGWSFNFQWKNGVELGFGYFDNPNWDIQNWIHTTRGMVTHPQVVAPSFTYSGSYSYLNTANKINDK
ncbi:MAG: hypothetical protein IPP32_12610 [Bacteroidetes bacterium]|nr:hypothetical protein [Bacteroidota bacterium]